MAGAADMSEPEVLSVLVRWTAEDAAAYTSLASAAQTVSAPDTMPWRSWLLRLGAAGFVGGVTLWKTWSAEAAMLTSTATFIAVYFAPELYTRDWTSMSAHADVMKSDPSPYEPTTVSIAPDGVSQTAGLLATSVRWGGIQDITQGKGIIMFWSSRASGLAVPVRCFDGQEAADAFVAQARRWRQAAVTGAAA